MLLFENHVLIKSFWPTDKQSTNIKSVYTEEVSSEFRACVNIDN